jgi:hypothetical protein
MARWCGRCSCSSAVSVATLRSCWAVSVSRLLHCCCCLPPLPLLLLLLLLLLPPLLLPPPPSGPLSVLVQADGVAWISAQRRRSLRANAASGLRRSRRRCCRGWMPTAGCAALGGGVTLGLVRVQLVGGSMHHCLTGTSELPCTPLVGL